MSHKTQVKTKLDNLTYLTKGLDDLGIKYELAKENQKLTTRGRYGVHEECDVIVTEVNGRTTNDAFGFQKQKDGTYTAIGDFYGTGVSASQMRTMATTSAKKVEANERLMQLGFDLEKVTEEGQFVELEFTRWV